MDWLAREWRTSSITAQLTASSLAPKTRKPVGVCLCVEKAKNTCSYSPFHIWIRKLGLVWQSHKRHAIVHPIVLRLKTDAGDPNTKKPHKHMRMKGAGSECKHAKNATRWYQPSSRTACTMSRAQKEKREIMKRTEHVNRACYAERLDRSTQFTE